MPPRRPASSTLFRLLALEEAFPDLPVVGWSRRTRVAPALGRHAHPGRIEICFLAEGHQPFRVGGATYALQPRELFVTFPGEVHSSHPDPSFRGELFWIQIRRPGRGRAFLGFGREAAAPLVEAARGLRRRHFRGEASLRPAFVALHRIAGEREDPAWRTRLAAAAAPLLLRIARLAREGAPARGAEGMEPVLAYVEKTLRSGATPPTVPELAGHAGLSVSRFKVRFKEAIGLSPGAYVAERRVERGLELLREGGRSVTEVAHALGYSSSQYFATVVRRFTGCPPGAFRAEAEA